MSEHKTGSREDLFYAPKNGWEQISPLEKRDCFAYCADYAAYLDAGRTEREAVAAAIALAETRGFRAYEPGMALKAGDRIYQSNRGRALMLAVIGRESLARGAVIAAAHVDSPRLDLKHIPLYEEADMAYFKTHYYGGIKKYQWTAIPLELHGVVYLRDGSRVDVVIGRDKADPQLVITDLLPHLGGEQMQKKANQVIAGEGLNLLIGSIPQGNEGSDRVKLAILSLLFDRYGIREEDFLSADLTAVPAFDTRDIGLDRGLIGAYGHDDRVCAYAELRAILDCKDPVRTAVCILADKEEIGSEGVSGMQSSAFETFMEDLCESQGVALRRCLEKSFCLSADVCNAYDPNFPEVSDKRNNARAGYGLAVLKHTGSGGKSGSSEADASIVADLRRVFGEAGVVWQMGELGKVDAGGGGTVAKFMAKRNIDTIDAGVPVLSMHAPFEVVSKLDCWMTYKGCKALYEMN